MALGGVFMKDTDNNIGNATSVSNQKVSGLIFDISKQAAFFTAGVGLAMKSKLQGNVIEVNSMNDLADLGITAYSGDSAKDLLFGIPYYHIQQYFKIQGNYGRLFIAFADCSTNFDIIEQMQRVAHGVIDHIGIWTEQSLWTLNDDSAATYSIALVNDLQSKAAAMADENSPLNILLSANSAVIKTATTDLKKVDLAKIPTCITEARYVTVLLGQGLDGTVQKMQLDNSNATPVGNIGAALGCESFANVSESIAWTGKFNLIGYFPDVEMGFGDVTTSGEPKAFASTLKYSSMQKPQLDTLDDKGYVFLCKYAGLESGVYFSKDRTCSKGDFRTIARNRAINKSRRLVRLALLPYINSPLKLNPATGVLSAAQITLFTNLVNDVLKAMVNSEDISGYVSASIDSTQNLLTNDTLIIKYSIVPVGVGSNIDVVEGLSLTNK